MTSDKDRLRLITRSEVQKLKAARYLVFLLILGSIIYSLTNTFIKLPAGIPFALLTIFLGLLLIAVTFLGIIRSPGADDRLKLIPISGFRFLFIYWVVSVSSIATGYSSLYTEIFRRSADSFVGVLGGVSSIYFSVVTFATVGYGDIYPVTAIARMLVISEILIPVCLLPVLLATSISWVIKKSHLSKTDSEVRYRNPFTRIK